MNRKGFLGATALRVTSGFRSLALMLILAQVSMPGAQAANPSSSKTQPLPSHPTAPKSIAVKQIKDAFGNCRRFLTSPDGSPIPCDSNIDNDALHLRPLVNDLPEAKNELDTYQSNRRLVRKLPYYSAMGLSMIAAGLLLRKTTSNDMKGIVIRNAFGLAGGLMILGTATYGAILLNTNEAHLDRAIQLHNQSNPGHTIGVQVRTEF